MKLKPGVRRKLPPERPGIKHTFFIDGMTVTITTGEYEDGTLGELFIAVDKEGGAWRSYDGMAIAMSIALQYNIPGLLETYIQKFEHMQMEPRGVTRKLKDGQWVDSDPDLAIAKSICDYLAKWLRKTYLPREACKEYV